MVIIKRLEHPERPGLCPSCGSRLLNLALAPDEPPGGLREGECQACADKWEQYRPAASFYGEIGGHLGGRSTSPAKQRASRLNGRLGGRPRKG